MADYKTSVYALLGVVIILFAFIIFAAVLNGQIPGDVDNSGEVDTCDYAMAKLYINGLIDLNFWQRYRADIDRDGDVDEVDYACIREIILGGFE